MIDEYAGGPDRTTEHHAPTGNADQVIDDFLPAMRGLRARAQLTNLARAAQLGTALEQVAAGELDEAGRARAVAVAHQLIGSAGTFGFAAASRRAGELKEFFTLPRIDEDDIQTARIRLADLRRSLQSDQNSDQSSPRGSELQR
jgi:HPt (histidine-containing phosphotransfer) domain-containing protein